MKKSKSTILTEIAEKHLGFSTLETRNSDSLDFHDISVWSIKKALEAAYTAGKKSKVIHGTNSRHCNRKKS